MPRVKLSQVAAVAALLLAALTLGGCAVVDSFYPPEAITSQGRQIRDLYGLVFIVAAAIFILVEALIVWTVLRYRRKPTDSDLPPQVHGNTTVEVIWTAIPTLIVAVLFFLSWQVLNTVDARANAPEEANIRATAARFQWTFQYLDKNGNVLFEQLAPEMQVPVGRPIHLTLASPDVNHSFYVPEMLFKRDVIPGRENFIDFAIDPQHAGQTFRGQCAHLCGTYHASMLFTMKAVTAAEYDAWIEEQTRMAQESPTPAPSQDGGEVGATLELIAKNVEFDQKELTAPADTAFAIVLDNQDAGVPHNVEIRAEDGSSLWKGDIFNGPEKRTYQVPALPAGSYTFTCTVHPNMVGTLTVE